MSCLTKPTYTVRRRAHNNLGQLLTRQMWAGHRNLIPRNSPLLILTQMLSFVVVLGFCG